MNEGMMITFWRDGVKRLGKIIYLSYHHSFNPTTIFIEGETMKGQIGMDLASGPDQTIIGFWKEGKLENSAQVVEITNVKEIHHEGLLQVYVAEPSVESAVMQFMEKWGREPEIIFKKNGSKGRVSIYIPVEFTVEEAMRFVKSRKGISG